MSVNMDCAVLPGVDPVRAATWCALGQRLGLDNFNPTWVNWDLPYTAWDPKKLAGNIAPLDPLRAASGGATLSEGEGYAIELGFGAFFTLLTMLLTVLETKFGGVELTSEHYNTAGRNVKTGLTASVIVSQWTWAATLLQSSNVAWQYGVTGPFWYAAGASIQILLFGVIAIEIKRKAPNAHTFLEIVDVRWGKCAHLTFMFFGIATNVIVSSMLLLGGTATMEAAAGIDIRLSGFLIPLGVVFYTFFGGLKATFLASYVHTTIIFVILVIFVTVVYGANLDDSCNTYDGTECRSLGSASIVYERLRFMNALPVRTGTVCGRTAAFIADAVATANATATFACDSFSEVAAGFEFTSEALHQGPATLGSDNMNRGGSYLTIMSLDGLQFGIINVIGNFGTVFLDQSYWQSAIAASPASATKGYLLGGLAWFTIPFSLATSLGLAGNALNVAITPGDANAGLVPIASAHALLGPAGAILVIMQLFMAITSTASAESIAVAGLWSYDVYRKYINPEATGAQIKQQSQIVVFVWSFLMIWFNWILWSMDISLGWVYNFMGIMIGSGVFPVAYCILWSKTSAMAAMTSAWVGMVCALITWLVTAASLYGDTMDMKAATGQLYPQLAGNCVSFFLSGLICTVWSLLAPQNYDFTLLNQGLKLVENDSKVLGAEWEQSPEFLKDAYDWILKYGGGYTIFLIICWPCMAIPWGVFTESVYNLWASVAFGWGYTASFVIIFLPIYENWSTIQRVLVCKPMSADEMQSVKKLSGGTTREVDMAAVQTSSA